MCLFLLLIACIVPVVQSQFATISLNPLEYTVPEPGETFTIDVNITDVPPLKYYEFKLEFDTTLLNATDVISRLDSEYTWNVSNGFLWVTANLSQTFWGINGTLMTINFTALKVGECALHLYNTKLINPLNYEILHDTDDGYINVVPEFPPAMLVALLLIATLAAASLGKIFWSRKRKCPRQTKITTKESYC